MGNIRGKKDKKESKELDEKDNHGQWPGNPQQTKNPSGKTCICVIMWDNSRLQFHQGRVFQSYVQLKWHK